MWCYIQKDTCQKSYLLKSQQKWCWLEEALISWRKEKLIQEFFLKETKWIEEKFFHSKVLSNMLTCVHNQAMGEVFMIGLETNLDNYSQV